MKEEQNRNRFGKRPAQSRWWRGGLAWFAMAPLLAPAVDTTPPSAPQNVRAVESSETSASLFWAPATDDVAVAGYQVHRDGTWLGTATVTNFTDGGPLDKYLSYEYTVSASDAAGNTSAPSATAVFAYRRFPFAMSWDPPASSSVTDLSDWSPTPANQFVISSNGHLYADSSRIRFWGVNVTFGVAFPEYAAAEQMAARLSRLGVNCVRFHHMDTQSTPTGIFLNVPKTDPRYRRALDPAQVDRLDYFIAQLKNRGIYANLNLHVGRTYAGFPTNGASSYFKGLDHFMPGMIDLQKEYARDLIAHTNAYTGLTYTEDPCVAFIEINNENGLIREWQEGLFGPDLHSNYVDELTVQWNDWLTDHYTNTAALATAWAPSPGSPYGRELLTNGNFETGVLAPWQLLVTSPATATSRVLVAGAPANTNALEIHITAIGTNTDDVRLVQGGWPVTQGQACTVTFWAQSDTPRNLRVGLAPDAVPAQPLAETVISVTTNWEQHTVVLAPKADEADARLSFGGLASDTGRVCLAAASVKTGNTLLGPPSAWPEGDSYPEMLVNGDLAAGFAPPWTFQAVSPASASQRILTNGAPDDGNALEINVITNDTISWHVQFYQTGLSVTNDQAYTIRFSARSESPRSAYVCLMQSGSPWAWLGGANVALNTNWQEYAVTIQPSADESAARLNFSSMAELTGRVWFASFSMKTGVPGSGLPAGETLGNVSLIRKDQFGLRSRATQRDWMEFLWDTERHYWTGMRDYLKNTLGARSLIIGTQTGYSPAPIQAELDVVDCHSYWQHPTFPNVAWDRSDWYVKNQPMTNAAGATIPRIAHTRVAGKPFICTEYNHSAPLTYTAETMPVIAAYAAMQDWDGVFAYHFLKTTNVNPQYFSEFFECAREPAKLISFPFAAAMLRRGDVNPAAGEARATVMPEMAMIRVGQTDVSLGANDFGVDYLLAFQQRLAIATGAVTQVRSAIRDATQSAIAGDTGQLTWDTANGLMTVRAPRVKAVIGHANQSTFDLGDGVHVTPGATMQGANWTAITLLMREGEGFQSTGRALITAAGYVDNHRMLWKTDMGPTDATSSVGTNWGMAPTLIEGVPADITLPVPAGQTTVWAVDGRGDRHATVPVSGNATQAMFRIGQEYKTPWYEVAVAPVDGDNDGMPDNWEFANFGGTNVTNGGAQADWDHDGMYNLAEYIAGTSPTNAGSRLQVSDFRCQTGTNFVIQWSSVADKWYAIQTSTNLLAGFDGWAKTNIPATPTMNTQTVMVDQVKSRFYRVTVDP